MAVNLRIEIVDIGGISTMSSVAKVVRSRPIMRRQDMGRSAKSLVPAP